jgi:hypothetical protein
VDRAAITFDWASRTFDYDRRFTDALFAGAGVRTSWVTEYARHPDLATLGRFRSGSGRDLHSAAEDIAIVTHAIPGAYMTRLRTRLAQTELDTDLTLRAASGGDIGTSIVVTRELNRAPEPICDTVCSTADGTEPGASSERGTGSGYRCAARPGAGNGRSVLLVLGLVVLALAWRRR